AVPSETTADLGSAYDVAYDVANMKAGQWLAYSVYVPVPGTYRVDLRVANASSGGVLHATIDGIAVGGSVNVPSTGGPQVWQTIPSTSFTQTVGPHTLK